MLRSFPKLGTNTLIRTLILVTLAGALSEGCKHPLNAKDRRAAIARALQKPKESAPAQKSAEAVPTTPPPVQAEELPVRRHQQTPSGTGDATGLNLSDQAFAEKSVPPTWPTKDTPNESPEAAYAERILAEWKLQLRDLGGFVVLPFDMHNPPPSPERCRIDTHRVRNDFGSGKSQYLAEQVIPGFFADDDIAQEQLADVKVREATLQRLISRIARTIIMELIGKSAVPDENDPAFSYLTAVIPLRAQLTITASDPGWVTVRVDAANTVAASRIVEDFLSLLERTKCPTGRRK